MLTATIAQLSVATSIADADLIEIEQSGVSKYGTVSMLETNLITNNIATTAQSLLASSNSALMTPIQVREAFNSNNAAPVYACRAWCVIDGTTTTSSINGTYTRAASTTLTVCIATAHGYISGNVANIDFTSGGASDNSYIVTVVDLDTFTVNTVSTSSILVSNLTLRRSALLAGGNVGSVSYVTTGTFYINFSVAMPSANYAWTYTGSRPSGVSIPFQDYDTPPTEYALYLQSVNISEANGAHERMNLAVFA